MPLPSGSPPTQPQFRGLLWSALGLTRQRSSGAVGGMALPQGSPSRRDQGQEGGGEEIQACLKGLGTMQAPPLQSQRLRWAGRPQPCPHSSVGQRCPVQAPTPWDPHSPPACPCPPRSGPADRPAAVCGHCGLLAWPAPGAALPGGGGRGLWIIGSGCPLPPTAPFFPGAGATFLFPPPGDPMANSLGDDSTGSPKWRPRTALC